MAHENAEDLTANVFVGRSVKHRSTIGFARHRSYGRTATVDKIAQPMGNLDVCRMSAFEGNADMCATTEGGLSPLEESVTIGQPPKSA